MLNNFNIKISFKFVLIFIFLLVKILYINSKYFDYDLATLNYNLFQIFSITLLYFEVLIKCIILEYQYCINFILMEALNPIM